MISPAQQITVDNADQLLEQLEKGFQDQSINLIELEASGDISDLFDQTVLTRLETIFAESTFGHFTLPASQFCNIISKYISPSLVENIYRSIDVNDVGYVEYSAFTNFLIASEAGSSFSARNFLARLTPYFSQENESPFLHRDAIDCMVYVKRPCPMVITGGRDGQLFLWEPEHLSLIKSIDHRDKNSLYAEELSKSMDTMLKAHTRRRKQHNAKPAKVQALLSI
jgi:hypothetical protein